MRFGICHMMLRSEILSFKGRPVIQYCAYRSNEGSRLFLDEARLLFVQQGSCTLTHGLKECVVGRAEMALLSRSVSIDLLAGAGLTDNVFLLFDLSRDLLQAFVKIGEWTSPGERDHSVITTGVADQKILTYIGSLTPYFDDPGRWGDPLIRWKLLELLFFLADSAPTLFGQLLDLRQNFRPDIRDTVEDNITSRLSLPELAALAGRSMSSFRRDFQAIYNIAPSQWIRQRRLERAGKLLTSTSLSVTEICYLLGFDSLSNFCRIFKAYYGRRPLEFKAGDFR
jgi:AraC-like DNA-binding protein